MLFAKIGFVTNDAVTALKLMEKGFPKEDLALNVLIDFPLQLIFGYFAAKWSTGKEPMKPWLASFIGRAVCCVLAMVVVHNFTGQLTNGYFILVMVVTILSSTMSTIQFVSISSFISSRADSTIGGTYMTFLQTVNNLGGTWPRYFILLAVELLTDAPCVSKDDLIDQVAINATITCGNESGIAHCKATNGYCNYIRDGYYYVNSVLLLLGITIFIAYIRTRVKRIQALPTSDWKLENIRLNGKEKVN